MLTVLASMSVVVLVAGFGPTFAAMYADFGADVELPTLTRWVISPIAVVLALPSSIVLGAGLRVHSLAARRASVVAAFVIALAAVMLCWIGLYLPLWQVAGSIRAE